MSTIKRIGLWILGILTAIAGVIFMWEKWKRGSVALPRPTADPVAHNASTAVNTAKINTAIDGAAASASAASAVAAKVTTGDMKSQAGIASSTGLNDKP
jgi:hypothetical protein